MVTSPWDRCFFFSSSWGWCQKISGVCCASSRSDWSKIEGGWQILTSEFRFLNTFEGEDRGEDRQHHFEILFFQSLSLRTWVASVSIHECKRRKEFDYVWSGGGVYLFLDCLSIPLHLQSMTRPLANVGVHSYIVIADKWVQCREVHWQWFGRDSNDASFYLFHIFTIPFKFAGRWPPFSFKLISHHVV